MEKVKSGYIALFIVIVLIIIIIIVVVLVLVLAKPRNRITRRPTIAIDKPKFRPISTPNVHVVSQPVVKQKSCIKHELEKPLVNVQTKRVTFDPLSHHYFDECDNDINICRTGICKPRLVYYIPDFSSRENKEWCLDEMRRLKLTFLDDIPIIDITVHNESLIILVEPGNILYKINSEYSAIRIQSETRISTIDSDNINIFGVTRENIVHRLRDSHFDLDFWGWDLHDDILPNFNSILLPDYGKVKYLYGEPFLIGSKVCI